MPARRTIPALAFLAAVTTIAFAGPIGISTYSGPAFPYSASFTAQTVTPLSGSGIRFGYWLEDLGTRQVNQFFGDASSGDGRYHMIGSAADPRVVYIDDHTHVSVLRFDDEAWVKLTTIPLRSPVSISFQSFTSVISDRVGSDIVFWQPASDTVSAIVDTDGDRIADSMLDRNGDTFDDRLKFGDFAYVSAISDIGTLYGATTRSVPGTGLYNGTLYTVRDTDGDFIPDTPAWPADARGSVDFFGIKGIGRGSFDTGPERLIVSGARLPNVIDLDGDGFPIATSIRPLAIYDIEPGSRVSPIPFSETHSVLHDGSAAAYWAYLYDYNVPEDSNHGVYILDDLDFDGTSRITANSATDLFPALTERMFDPREPPGTPFVPELTELRSFSGGNQTVTFAAFGIWPDGRAFSFRQAGVEHASMTVSLDGLLSFVGPVGASPSLATLEAIPGLVAPAWSDQWDTSQVRVYAGCAPVQRRFADGSGAAALSFVIEWRGLISPNGKRTSLRCLLLEDGSFRVDYGAMETGTMPLTVGYSTSAAGAIVVDDLSDNSWGGQPAGTLDEAKLGEEFGAAKPFDLSHKWVRFAGYGDVRGPRPELIGVALKKGSKIQMKASGSNIQSGATLVVDGVETFVLSKSATGSKWIVTKKARSAPSTATVADIWNDGLAHSIVVVNPDGGQSTVASLQ